MIGLSSELHQRAGSSAVITVRAQALANHGVQIRPCPWSPTLADFDGQVCPGAQSPKSGPHLPTAPASQPAGR